MRTTGITIVTLVAVLGLAGILMLGPIPQDPEYHVFVDQRTIFGIPNFWNVVSNLPFLIVGALGLYGVLIGKLRLCGELKAAYVLLFAGMFVVAIGSAYYHLFPDDESLVWDRLPMTIAFMSLFAVIIGEFVSIDLAKKMLVPLILLGIASVLYWHIADDLRSYILIQFLPLLLIPLVLLFFRPRFSHTCGYWILLAAYVLAKVLEHYDEAIYQIPFLISGHSFKHIVAAVGILFLLSSYYSREFKR